MVLPLQAVTNWGFQEMRTLRLFLLLIIGLIASPHAGADETTDAAGPFAAAIARAQSCCVKIYGGSIGRSPGYATGILVSEKGEILTEQGTLLASSNLRVVLPDGSEHLAKVLRRSTDLQIALLQIDVATPNFFDLSPSVTPPDSGDWILAVSNAFKVADGEELLSVNLGVLNQRTRLEARRGVQDFPYNGDVFLLDAITSNPGAAGGAVVDVDGNLVGMIGKVIEGTATNTRLNYAVPRDLLHGFLSGKEMPGTSPMIPASVVAGDLGVRLFPLGGRKSPAYIDRVLPNSPAAMVGIRADDLVVSLAGQPVRDVGDFQRIAETLPAGTEVVLEIKRRNELLSFKVTPVAKP